MTRGKMAVTIPSFNEYVRCFCECELVPIYSSENDYQLDACKLMEMAKEVDVLAIINPDNPSGSFLSYDELIRILDVCRQENTRCIVDESFIDFAEKEQRYTLLKNDLLETYPNLIVVKSISKSYGVPGLRLGILASSDREFMDTIRQNMAIWNINSFGEYFLQIYSLYKGTYADACDKIAQQRAALQKKLSEISFLKVYPSQANYIMCEVSGRFTSKELTTKLLSEQNLLIKDLSGKNGFNGRQFIRVAVKNELENEMLYQALKSVE